ncbi:MAG: tRNA isopentenyltransferase (miaA) [Bacteroidetes bacterium]|nr:MAG: tRNA isopentenyltransferase (miaA) [Bacteroidota bacterium]
MLGPTASGKTAVSVQLARKHGCSVVSADSRQLFREMPLGTAAPSEKEMQGVPHYFIGSHSVSEAYDAGKFEKDALQKLDQLFSENPVQLLCGGSGMYIDAVCKGFDELPLRDDVLREELKRIFDTEGIFALQEKLRLLDPVYFEKADRQNPHRLMRAIEVCSVSGKPYSEQRKGTAKERPFRILKIGIELDREALYARINARVDEMVGAGLAGEVRSLEKYRSANALQTVGYKEFFDHFDGKTDLETAVGLVKQHTRNFARRQLTWFRKDKSIRWFAPADIAGMLSAINEECPDSNVNPIAIG